MFLLCHAHTHTLSLPPPELTKELETVRKAAAANKEVGALREEMQVVRCERDKAVSENKSLCQRIAGLEHSEEVCYVPLLGFMTHNANW